LRKKINDLSSKLGTYGFERVGAIESDSEGNFKSMSNLSEYHTDPEHNNIRQNETPSVYVWALEREVEEKKTPITAFYVGKAGKGFFPERFKGHRNGSMPGKGGSPSGRNRWKLLKLIIGPKDSNYTIGVYERKSKEVDASVLKALGLGSLVTAEFIKKIEGIRMNSSEEEIFIEYFKQFGIHGELVGNNINDLGIAMEKIQAFLQKT
jgi:hypothetical protein